MSISSAGTRRLGLSFILLFPALLGAQTITPSISSIASGFGPVSCTGQPSICTAAHGNAVTAGATPPAGNTSDLQLFINGNFNASVNSEDITWTEGSTVVDLCAVGFCSANNSQLVAENVPSDLYTPNGATTQRAVTITVTECPFIGYAFDRFRPRQSCPQTSTTYFINPPLANVSNPLPGGVINVHYSQNFFSGGTSPYTVTFSNNMPPPGLQATATSGNPLTGTPTQAGTYPVNPVVLDAWSCGCSNANTDFTVSNSVTVVSQLVITTASPLPPGAQGQSYSATIQAVNGTPPYVWSVTGQPAGLTINSSTGVLSGTPTASGTFTQVMVTAVDSGTPGQTQQMQTMVYSITINPTLQITSTSLPNGVAGQAYSSAVTATGGQTPYTYSASGLPANLVINTSTGAIFGTPTTAGSYPVTLGVSDSGPGQAAQRKTLNVTLLISNDLTITTASLPAGVAGQSYSATLMASGGTTPYTWSSSALPANLSLNSSTGVISGTPTTAGSYPVTATVTDSGIQGQNRQSQQMNYTIVVSSGLTITTASLPAGVAGQAYSATVMASGGATPYTWSSTALPANLSLNSSTGVISGTPTTAGSYPVTVTVTDSGIQGQNRQSQQMNYTIVVSPVLTITTSSLPAGAPGQAYSATLMASGGVTPYTWSSTALPANLSLNASTGVISGMPNSAGSYPVTVTVTDSGTQGQNRQTQQMNYTIVVSTSLTITTTSLPAGVAGQAYSATVMASGGTPSYTWSSTALPANLSLNSSTGVISGTPTTAGSYPVTVTVTDSGTRGQNQQTQHANFTIVVSPVLTITTSSLPAGAPGQAYSATLMASGGVTPYTWSSTALPANLSLNASTGVISGTPNAAGNYPVTVTVTDSGTQGQNRQTQQMNYTIVVSTSLTITTASLPAGVAGQAYSATLTASGGTTPYTWSSTPLPANLSLNASTGVISGTPTAAGNYPVTVTVTDSGTRGQNQQSQHANFTIVVSPVLTITTTSLPSGIQGQSYSTTVAASGGVTPYAWSATGLPAGLSINSSTGVISGTPTAAGTFPVSVAVVDSGTPGQNQQRQQANLNLTIISSLTITSTTLPQGRVGLAYNATATASGGTTPYSWSATGLPQGLSINQTSGAITGTPTTAGVSTVTLMVSDSGRQSTQINVSLQIVGVLTVTTTSLPGGTVGQIYSGSLQAQGGTTPYTWTATGLPNGLTLSPNGVISGTPTQANSFAVVFHVSDSNTQIPQTAQANITIVIKAAPPPPLQITTSSLPGGTVGQLYSPQLGASGGSGSYSFTVLSGALPPGVTLATSGLLYGTPTAPGSYAFTAQVTDDLNDTASHAFTIVIAPATLAVTGAPPATASLNSTISVQFGATGGVGPYKFALSGNPPAGTSFSSSGLLSGAVTATGPFTFTITATDSQTPPASASKTFTITVNPGAINITGNLPTGQVGQAYSGQFSATGGTGGYTFSGTAGNGLSVSSSGAVSGTPTSPGTVAVSVTVTDSSGAQATGNFSITINGPTLTITTTTLPDGALTVAYSASVGATGGMQPYTWSATGLPDGLSINATTGAITGTPTALGSFNVSVTVTDANAVKASASLALTVDPAPLKITTTGISAAQVGQSYSVSFAATGGTAPYAWSATGLPNGLAMAANGTLSGTPTVNGSFPIVVTVTDSSAPKMTATANVTLSVTLPPAPGLTFTGLPANSSSATQLNSTLTFTNTYPVDVTVTLTLTFAPANGPDDPNIQFATGGRTTTVTVKAGSTTSLSNFAIQTGTVAGTITITATMSASGTDITPSPAPTTKIVIPAAAPTITSVAAASNGTGFTVTIVGFDPTRSITQLTFTFTPAAGSTLTSSTVTVSAASLFSAWWQSSQAAPFGSQFSFTIPFTVSGSVSGIASVSVTATNSTGTSTAVSATIH